MSNANVKCYRCLHLKFSANYGKLFMYSPVQIPTANSLAKRTVQSVKTQLLQNLIINIRGQMSISKNVFHSSLPSGLQAQLLGSRK